MSDCVKCHCQVSPQHRAVSSENGIYICRMEMCNVRILVELVSDEDKTNLFNINLQNYALHCHD